MQLNATSTGKPIFYKEIEKKKKKSSNNTSRKKAEFQTYKRKTTRQKLGGIIDDAIFLEKLARKMDREGCCTDLLNFNINNWLIGFLKTVSPTTPIRKRSESEQKSEEIEEDKFGQIIQSHASEAVSFFAKEGKLWISFCRATKK